MSAHPKADSQIASQPEIVAEDNFGDWDRRGEQSWCRFANSSV